MKKSILIPYDQYLALTESRVKNTDKPFQLENGSTNQIEDNFAHQSHLRMSDDNIVSLLPVSLKKRAERLLKFIKSQTNIDWNDIGVVYLDNQPIRNSHICDILHFLTSNSKSQPNGCAQVLKALKNLPFSLIANQKAKVLVGGNTSNVIPPGVPETFRELNSWQTNWKAL